MVGDTQVSERLQPFCVSSDASQRIGDGTRPETRPQERAVEAGQLFSVGYGGFPGTGAQLATQILPGEFRFVRVVIGIGNCLGRSRLVHTPTTQFAKNPLAPDQGVLAAKCGMRSRDLSVI